jgi:hypothetical protein
LLNAADKTGISELIHLASRDLELMERKADLARYFAHMFELSGRELHVIGHFFGTDHSDGTSPRGHGSDETVGVSAILRIASQLLSASADLFMDGRTYAAAALTRQIVEIEYLTWAFAYRDKDAERWLRSSRKERENFFRPAILRKAAEGLFRGVDYSYHCELGGHPVPGGTSLLPGGDAGASQLLLSDVIGHAGRIWNNAGTWAHHNAHGRPILSRGKEMAERFNDLMANDPLNDLPPPPEWRDTKG